jgi:hypothetical protein
MPEHRHPPHSQSHHLADDMLPRRHLSTFGSVQETPLPHPQPYHYLLQHAPLGELQYQIQVAEASGKFKAQRVSQVCGPAKHGAEGRWSLTSDAFRPAITAGS